MLRYQVLKEKNCSSHLQNLAILSKYLLSEENVTRHIKNSGYFDIQHLCGITQHTHAFVGGFCKEVLN